MVCSNEEGTFKVTVHDSVQEYPSTIVKVIPSSLVGDIYGEIVDSYTFLYDGFELTAKNRFGEEMELNGLKDKTWNQIGVFPTSDVVLVVTPPKNKTSFLDPDELYLGASASPTTEFATNEECSSTALFNYDRNIFHNAGRRKATQLEPIIVESPTYVGLVNQAMTCYLNSLLQALYMTPEFRNALYNWEFDGSSETMSIPYQLQKLFLNLQTSSKSAVETTDLTTSFGWQGSDAWHQHDIQELCRVMFDALEKKFKDTKQANLINDLYEGKMLDYVKCLECTTEKSREDCFLDIPLPVRPFGSTVAYNSVEEALRAFVQPETLDGNNQYFCEKCNKKCDAHKGLKFTKFPYLLTLHLKRFDFDYNTMHRIKLNDKVVFPEKLNLNSFIPACRTDTEPGHADGDTAIKCDDSSTTDSGSADDESCQGTDLSAAANGQDDNCADSDEGIDVSSGNNHDNEAKGPYIYELFSIMIHSGSASGGHYYAYIKDFDKNLWFCFNDQSVTSITEDDITKIYGGGPQRAYYSGAFSSSTNAYMLMYRQIDKERNSRAMTVNEFPPHINNLLRHMRVKEEQDRLNRKREDEMIKINVVCGGSKSYLSKTVRIATCSDTTLGDAAQLAYNRFKLDGLVDLNDCRLVVCNDKNRSIVCSFESEDMRVHELIVSNAPYTNWMLDIREPGTEWKQYKKNGITVYSYPINVETGDIGEPQLVRIDEGDRVRDVKDRLSQLSGVNLDNTQLVLQLGPNAHKYFSHDSEPIRWKSRLNDIDEYKLYVASNVDKLSAKLKKTMILYMDVITLSVHLPIITEGVMESMSIPYLDLNQNTDKPEQNSDKGTNSPLWRVSPQPAVGGSCGDGYDQSNSEDSSLSDSDRTLIGDAPTDCLGVLSSSSTSSADHHMSSPSDPCRDTYNYDVLGIPGDETSDEEAESEMLRSPAQFFKMAKLPYDSYKMPNQDYIVYNAALEKNADVSTGNPDYNVYHLLVDKRMTLDVFKKKLAGYLRIPSEYFKVFRNNLDDEQTKLSETLQSYSEGDLIIVQLGRVLREDEHLCKVYHLRPDDMDGNNLLFEHVITKNQTVGSVKKDILQHAKKEKQLDIQYSKCRLREKNWKKPKKVYLDDQKFGEDIMLSYNSDLYLQELTEAETVTSSNQVVVFLRRWYPASLTLGPFQEAILDVLTMDDLKQKVSDVSGIPIDHLDVTFIKGTYPCDMHLLEIHSIKDWNPKVKKLDQWPMSVDDGCMFLYKDSREIPKELTAEEQQEIRHREDVRLGRSSIKTYLPGREKPLRIYLLDSSPAKTDENVD